MLYFIFYLLMPFYLFSDTFSVAICAIFKNEQPYLKEWIEFHKLQGVEHFYLYNNQSTDAFLQTLDPYIKNHEVTLINWLYSYKPAENTHEKVEWLAVQSGAYNDCLKKFGDLNNWIAFIDVDEFLFCPTGTKLPKFLEDYEEFGGIGVNWLLFGTSNLDDLDPKYLLIENLIYCAEENDERNFNIKSIVQPKFTKSCLNAHIFSFLEGLNFVSAEKSLIPSGSIRSKKVSLNKIRINHYWTRSKNYFIQNKIPNRQNRRSFQSDDLLLNWADRYNKEINLDIQQFTSLLKNRCK